ncbi:MAG TPA: DNA polymerase III subunit delta [Methylomirabilota bacterium]|nr:DNA polymerase III subunit delta [Methylomirabilota bacterium]
MDYATFLRAADAGQMPPVALLHGAEPFLLEEAVARATRGLFPGQTDPVLAREVLEARDVGADAIVQAALTLPWTGARRLVVARGVQQLPAKQAEPLVAYARFPNPSTALLLLADQVLEASHWCLKALPPAAVVAATPPSGPQLVSWLVSRAHGDGLELSEEAAALLVELCGDDLTQLLGEVEKAALVGGPDNRRVGPAEVRLVVGEHRLRHIFELGRAVAQGDAATGLGVLEALLGAGEEPLRLLAILTGEARAIWQASEALAAGRRPEDAARALRRPPAAASLVVDRARALRTDAPVRLLRRCWDAERRLKLGAAPRPELSLLVADLCAG